MNRFLATFSIVAILFSVAVLVLTPKIASALAARQPAESLLTRYVKPTGLHLRTGPSTEHAVLCTLRKSEAVQVVDDSSYWWRVTTRCGGGWVSSKYLEGGASNSLPEFQDPGISVLGRNVEDWLRVIGIQVSDLIS